MTWNCRRPFLYLTLGIIQAIHSIEEYLTHLQDWFPVVTSYIHNHTGFFPILRMRDQTFVALNILIITFVLSVGPFVYQKKHWALRVAEVVAVVEILNGIAHISSAIYVWNYYPGCISAIGLLVVGALFYMSRP
jgi:Protein of unknown function with HXXEE motif